jgi:hypothetical protein
MKGGMFYRRFILVTVNGGGWIRIDWPLASNSSVGQHGALMTGSFLVDRHLG